MSLSLRSYQVEDREWLRRTPRAYLAADPGAGKTATVLAALRAEDLPVLVVAPAQVARHTWPQEIQRWRPDLSVCVLPVKGEVPRADVYVVSYSVLHKVQVTQGRTLVLDEAQYVKTWSSTRSKAALALSKRFANVWLLSGTPVGNSLQDIWHQAKVLDGGQSLGRTLGGFRNEYMVVGKRDPRTGQVWRWDEKPGSRDMVFERLGHVMRVRRIEDLVDLPPLVPVYRDVPLTAREARVYREMEREAVVELDGGVEVAALEASAVSIKLRQVCAGCVLDEDGVAHEVGKAKLAEVRSLVEQVCGPDLDSGQVVVWTQFRAEQASIMSAFGGKTATKETLSEWLDGRLPVLVAHPASMGAGLNLQTGGCHHEIWMSPTWSLDQWVQAEARLHRSGQESTVVSYRLRGTLPRGGRTVDHAVYDALDEKGDLLQALRGALHV